MLSGKQSRHRALLICAPALLCAMAFTGYALMPDCWQGVLQQVNQLVYLLAATCWIGGLLPLVMQMRAAGDITLPLLPRYAVRTVAILQGPGADKWGA
uniref:Uncharacterized protein n=1 Tax=Erwinia amylovora ATCC BAA-2158 TaxID=889211 RepID=E5B692_ERWAM|nr:hypothetical protein predicted by Glimmer/Critica [Erwinia amylovora ATCC BAA-2158]